MAFSGHWIKTMKTTIFQILLRHENCSVKTIKPKQTGVVYVVYVVQCMLCSVCCGGDGYVV